MRAGWRIAEVRRLTQSFLATDFSEWAIITPKTRQFRALKKKSKPLIISGLDFLSVGITGLEPATSRPPEATQLTLNPVENQRFLQSLYLAVDVLVYFSPPFDYTINKITLSLINLESATKLKHNIDICKYSCVYFLDNEHFFLRNENPLYFRFWYIAI